VPHNKGKGKAAQTHAAAAAAATAAAATPAPIAAEAIQPQIAVPEAAPVVSMTALQQLEDKRKRLCNQLKDVERQVGQAAGCQMPRVGHKPGMQGFIALAHKQRVWLTVPLQQSCGWSSCAFTCNTYHRFSRLGICTGQGQLTVLTCAVARILQLLLLLLLLPSDI
jgi:hypothetical protein